MPGQGEPLPRAELYLNPVGRGNSQPQKFLLDSGLGLCVVKFKQNPQGPRMLANEWIGHGLAALLGIRHAPYGLVQVPAAALPDDGCLLIRDDEGDEVRLLPGIHFYSKWLEPAADLKPEDLGLSGMVADVGVLAGVAVLDTLLGHWDRKPLNPNLLMVREHGQSSLYLIDMGMAFGSTVWGLGNFRDPELPDVSAPLPYSLPPDQLFRAVRAPQDFPPYLERVGRLSAADFKRLMDGIPEEWGVTVEARQALVHYLSTRANALPAHFQARFGRSEQGWWR